VPACGIEEAFGKLTRPDDPSYRIALNRYRSRHRVQWNPTTG